MPTITHAEIIRRLEKIREYHKLSPVGTERLHINRGRQLMYELLKDIFGDPLTEPTKTYQGDWEMLFTQCGAQAVNSALNLQQQVVQEKPTDEQQRKIELAALRLALQTTSQVKAMLLDTAAGNLALKAQGDISPQGLIRRLENELSKGPTPPPGQHPFSWQAILDQRDVAGLRAWVAYELKVAQYELAGMKEEKSSRLNFEINILKNKVAYLEQVLKHLPE